MATNDDSRVLEFRDAILSLPGDVQASYEECVQGEAKELLTFRRWRATQSNWKRLEAEARMFLLRDVRDFYFERRPAFSPITALTHRRRVTVAWALAVLIRESRLREASEALNVSCQTCQAAQGAPCVFKDTGSVEFSMWEGPHFHPARLETARGLGPVNLVLVEEEES